MAVILGGDDVLDVGGRHHLSDACGGVVRIDGDVGEAGAEDSDEGGGEIDGAAEGDADEAVGGRVGEKSGGDAVGEIDE